MFKLTKSNTIINNSLLPKTGGIIKHTYPTSNYYSWYRPQKNSTDLNYAANQHPVIVEVSCNKCEKISYQDISECQTQKTDPCELKNIAVGLTTSEKFRKNFYLLSKDINLYGQKTKQYLSAFTARPIKPFGTQNYNELLDKDAAKFFKKDSNEQEQEDKKK